jgi:NAD(P)H-flavin reductase
VCGFGPSKLSKAAHDFSGPAKFASDDAGVYHSGLTSRPVPAPSTPAPRRFSVELMARSELSPRVQTLRFRARSGISWAAGQYLELFLPRDSATGYSFSLASSMDPRAPGEFELAVARGGSAKDLDEMAIGTELEAEGPRGSFTWQPLGETSAVLIGVGTGVAPLRALIQEQIRHGGATRLILLCGYRDERDVLWDGELRSLVGEHARFSFEPTLSQPSGAWAGRRGRVQDHIADLIDPLGSDLCAYVCGRTAMVADVTRRLRERHGIARIKSEGY